VTGREDARAAARVKLAALFPGQLGLNFADEVADAVLEAAGPAVRTAAIREAADALEAQSCTCGCRRAVEFLLTLADTATAPTTED
jgi:hypothetical protein